MRARPPYFTAAQIAACVTPAVHKRTIIRRARRENWPRQRSRNRIVFSPPAEIVAACAARFMPTELPNYTALFTTLRRAFAVFEVLRLLRVDPRVSRDSAVNVVCWKNAGLKLSASSVLRWLQRAERDGLAGLNNHWAGRSGRKPARRL